MSHYALLSLLISVVGIIPFTYIMMWIEGIKSYVFSYPTHPISFTIVPLIVFYFLAKWCERKFIHEKGAKKKILKHVKDTWILYLSVPGSVYGYYVLIDLCTTPQSECIDIFGIILGALIVIAILGHAIYVFFPNKKMHTTP